MSKKSQKKSHSRFPKWFLKPSDATVVYLGFYCSNPYDYYNHKKNTLSSHIFSRTSLSRLSPNGRHPLSVLPHPNPFRRKSGKKSQTQTLTIGEEKDQNCRRIGNVSHHLNPHRQSTPSAPSSFSSFDSSFASRVLLLLSLLSSISSEKLVASKRSSLWD
jgi:hypothetical protein